MRTNSPTRTITEIYARGGGGGGGGGGRELVRRTCEKTLLLLDCARPTLLDYPGLYICKHHYKITPDMAFLGVRPITFQGVHDRKPQN